MQHQNGDIQGYYIGYKEHNTSTPYIYITRMLGSGFKMEYTINNLQKFAEYSIHVQAFNSKGGGPKSADVNVFTLEDGKLCCCRL